MRRPEVATQALLHAFDALTCPVCDAQLTAQVTAQPGRAVCSAGHAFDIARQGYLNLGASQKDARADSAAMVMAREKVQASGAFDSIADAVCDAAARALTRHGAPADGQIRAGAPAPEASESAQVVDLAGGTGFYTARVLDHVGALNGLVLDLSVPALKRAARAHPALAAVGADLTRGIPLRDASVDLILNVFGPRNGPEMRRILHPDGSCIVVAPRVEHLTEIVQAVGMLRVAPNKTERVAQAMQRFTVADSVPCTYTREVTRENIERLIMMGPSAHHLSATDLVTRMDELFDGRSTPSMPVTFSVDITTFTPA